MRLARTPIAALSAVVALGLSVGSALAAKPIPAPWKNCTQVNKTYPHGIGRAGAHDKTTGTPVTTFKRSTRPYAMTSWPGSSKQVSERSEQHAWQAENYG